jgi:hypothetical protein
LKSTPFSQALAPLQLATQTLAAHAITPLLHASGPTQSKKHRSEVQSRGPLQLAVPLQSNLHE